METGQINIQKEEKANDYLLKVIIKEKKQTKENAKKTSKHDRASC